MRMAQYVSASYGELENMKKKWLTGEHLPSQRSACLLGLEEPALGPHLKAS